MVSDNVVHYPFSGATSKGNQSSVKADKLLFAAEMACYSRRRASLNEILKSLADLPLEPDGLEGFWFYSAYLLGREGRADQGYRLIINLLDAASIRYRARAYNWLAAQYFKSSEFDEAERFYKEGINIVSRSPNFDAMELCLARNLAASLGAKGKCGAALDILQSLRPEVERVTNIYPAMYFDYLNNLAVELAAVGRIGEAQYYSDLAVASPFSSAFPEWKETRAEIAFLTYKTPKSKVALTGWTDQKVIAFPVKKGGCE